MTFPENLRYTDSHIWVEKEGSTATIGITDYAQDQLGDILFVDLPDVGTEFTRGDVFSEVESSKTATELPMPVDGEVVAVNENLDDAPEDINDEPYEAWIIKVKTKDSLDDLMTAGEYEDFIQ
ncbi:MAG: glycine cleavage system protein GcvH [Lachnospiraceae bacterium]|nr:glycine cleavage system protein GcvH [Lachnospiraceae bacterium]